MDSAHQSKASDPDKSPQRYGLRRAARRVAANGRTGLRPDEFCRTLMWFQVFRSRLSFFI